MSQIASVIGGEARCAMSCAMSHSFGLAAGCIAADLGFCFVFGLVWFVFFFLRPSRTGASACRGRSCAVPRGGVTGR